MSAPIFVGGTARANTSAGPFLGPGEIIVVYVLLDVSNGTAFVESADGVRQVRSGSVLPGAGRVIYIVRQEGTWTLLTPQGVIRNL